MTSYINSHYQKIELKYDNIGLKEKYVIVYCNTSKGEFGDAFNKYEKFLKEYHFQHKRQGEIENITYQDTNIRILKTTHIREEQFVFLYHILILFTYIK